MQKRRNDVKARTTLLLALPDEHQLRFSKYKTAQELWGAILKTFGGNEATKKTKKNQLKQQYGNFKAEGSETLEQTFNRPQTIVSHLEFMDVEIKQNDLNQKFLTSLALEWLMYIIMWRNRANISSGKGEVNTASIPTASTQVTPASANVAAANISHDIVCAYIASQFDGSQIKYEDINQIDEDDIKEMDINWNMALLRWDWSYMANEEENHALVADEEAPTEFALMENPIKKEKEDLDSKLTGFESASKDLDTLLESQRSDKNKERLRYSAVPPSCSRESYGSILSKPMIKFVKSADSPTVIKTNKVETIRKPSVNYAKMYRNTSKSPKLRGNQRNWNNLKTQQLGKDFVMQNKACFKCGQFDHLAYDCGVWVNKGKTWPKNNYTHKSMSSKNVFHKTDRTPAAGNSQNIIDDKGYWDSGCSWNMTGNISYLFDYEPYDGGYVSFGQGGGKITGKGIIKTSKLEFENVYFMKDLKYNMFSVSQICDNKNSVLFTDSECIVLERNFKLKDDTNVLLRTPRQHNMYSIDLNNIVPHKDLTCLVAKASADERKAA
nr:ribonuclease H-like domain-containing protein [Tanacetum cinerariifolium]